MPQESNEQFQQFFLQLQARHRQQASMYRKHCAPLLRSTFHVLFLCCENAVQCLPALGLHGHAGPKWAGGWCAREGFCLSLQFASDSHSTCDLLRLPAPWMTPTALE